MAANQTRRVVGAYRAKGFGVAISLAPSSAGVSWTVEVYGPSGGLRAAAEGVENLVEVEAWLIEQAAGLGCVGLFVDVRA